MTPAEFSTTIYRQVGFAMGLQIRAGAGAPYEDLTDWNFTGTLNNAAGTQLATVDFVLAQPDFVQMRIAPEITSTLAKQFGATLFITATRGTDTTILPLALGRVSIV
jgi:hypothetical protein